MSKVVRIKAFRAIDDPELCEKFIDGHARVLSSVGVEKVTSSTNDWMHNPAAFVVICEDMQSDRVFGGARIHIHGGNQDLPIVGAVEEMDPKVRDVLASKAPEGTGEFCGLWNSLEVAGWGIGAIYLIRSSVAIINQLKVNTMFALCSPFTARIAGRYGFKLFDELGNDGTFYYPKIDLLATVVFNKDIYALEGANEHELKRIKSLRADPAQVLKEENRGKEVEIHYELDIENIDTSHFNYGKTL